MLELLDLIQHWFQLKLRERVRMDLMVGSLDLQLLGYLRDSQKCVGMYVLFWVKVSFLRLTKWFSWVCFSVEAMVFWVCFSVEVVVFWYLILGQPWRFILTLSVYLNVNLYMIDSYLAFWLQSCLMSDIFANE